MESRVGRIGELTKKIGLQAHPQAAALPFGMRALMNFMYRDGWSTHILAADCKTVLVGYRSVRDQETLLRIVAKLGGSVADAETDIRRWNRGSVWIEPSLAQCRALGISCQGHEGNLIPKSGSL